MKKFLLMIALSCAVSAAAQDAAQGSAAQGSTQSAAPVIKDPAEYNAFMTAQTMSDNNQKAAALEGFVQQYPNSVVKEDALAGAMAAYQAAGNQQKMMEAAGRLLEQNPNNVLGLFVRVYGLMQNTGANAEQSMREARGLAERALPLLQGRKKPDGMTDQQFADQNKAFAGVFNGAIGKAALQAKEFPAAIQAFKAAMQAAPTDPNNAYFLGSAYLSQNPITDEDRLMGIWYMGRTIAMVPNWDVPVKLGKYHLKKYHGTSDDFDQLVLAPAKASTNGNPPQGWAQSITKFVPPSPKETAAKMLQENSPEKMDFGSWIYILTSGNPQAADTVWNALQGKALRFQGWVLETGKDKLGMAVTEDGFQAKKVEVVVTMLDPMKTAPAVGAEFKVQAVPTTYTAEPFIMNMEQGQNLDAPPAGAGGKGKAKGKAPAKASAKASAKKGKKR